MMNLHCAEHGKRLISYTTVKRYLQRPEVQNMIEGHRYGKKSLDSEVLPYLPRKEEAFAGNLWVMDGTPVQFFCWNGAAGKDKKRIKLNLYVIVDAFSRKVGGFDVSVSEDRFNVLGALKMALSLEGHLACFV